MTFPSVGSNPGDPLREQQVPICVDLDGTLLRSDLLIESALRLLSAKPWVAFLFPFWLVVGGKARLKREIAARVVMEVDVLPFDERALELAAC